MNKILIVCGIMLLCFSGISSATIYTVWSVDGSGTWVNAFAPGVSPEAVQHYNDDSTSVYVRSQICVTYHHSGCRYLRLYYGDSPATWLNYYSGTGFCTVPQVGCDEKLSKEVEAGKYHLTSGGTSGTYMYKIGYFLTQISKYPITQHTVSGITDCVNYVNLSVEADSGWEELNSSTSSSYSFDIYNDTRYKLHFSDDHEYVFTCLGNEEYDYDACSYYTLNLLDNCANPLINATTTIFENMTDIIYQGTDNPIELMIGLDIDNGAYIQVIIDTHDGAIQFNDYVSEIEQDVFHPTVDWFLNIHVVDDSTDADISSAKITKSQTCSIIPPDTGHALTQSTGHVVFTGLANSDVSIKVEKDGYTTYNGAISLNFDAWCPGGAFTVFLNASGGNSSDNWNNGTHNDTVNTDGAGGEVLPNDHGWGCGVYFKNLAGVITDTINDTDTHVDMYYWTKGSDATLKFQSQQYTYWYTDQEYAVTNNTYEYRRILNADFTDHTMAYRGYIYNTSTECNCIQVLNIINQSYEQETHYENLTSQCYFAHKLVGNQIDYRSNVEINIYGNSSNSTLMNITVYLHNGTSMVASKALNWADFVTGSPKWWYVWEPSYSYKTGFNYTVNITGFDGYQLDIDEVWTANIVGNTLTVHVKDNKNAPISYSTVFIEGFGSIATASEVYVEVAGLPDGATQYKATKSGYTSSGWNTINLSGEDKTVTSILIKQSDESVTGYKLKDDEIKSFFLPLIYILFIMIIIGGLMNAAKN